MPRSRTSSLTRNQSRSRSRSPDPANQARGYKATLSNPHVSREAKEHAKRVLDEEFDGVAVSSGDEEGFKNPSNVARGLKAATHNPNVTDTGKRQAQKKLEQMESDY